MAVRSAAPRHCRRRRPVSPPTTDMNPVLLKPESDTHAQVIVNGRAIGTWAPATITTTSAWRAMRCWPPTGDCRQATTLIVEGAGSPAEINLRAGDIANMGFAEAVDCPVVLIADIDRGGVFAHLVGTMALLATASGRVTGFVINRFRGDAGLLQPGLHWLAQPHRQTGFGVLPYLHGLQLDAEDGISRAGCRRPAHALRVLVPVLPRISNHTDFDPLRAHPQVELRFVEATSVPVPPMS